MANNVQTLKGFRDFLGVDYKKRQWLIDNIRSVFERFGFEPLETPALEYESLLMGKYGEEADKLVYSFEDKGKRRVALRYDQTVPTARIVSQYQNHLVLPYKRYQIQPVWRADKPQKGRYREFLQCDADIIGSNTPLADAEIITLFAAIYKQIGITTLKIQVNDRETLIKVILSSGVTKKDLFSVIQTLDKFSKITEEEILAELSQKGITLAISKKVLERLNTPEWPESIGEIFKLVKEMGVDADTLEYSPYLARGLDYYTGIIFEGYIPEYPVGSIGGGGRYDNLIKDLIGIDMPASGFGLGFDRTLEAAEALGKVPQFDTSAKVLVTIFSPVLLENSIKCVRKLRGENISCELYLEVDAKLDKQLKYADRKGIEYVAIIGPEEKGKNVVKLKNMQTGEQETLSLEQLIKKLSN